jgi:hypothetical protein
VREFGAGERLNSGDVELLGAGKMRATRFVLSKNPHITVYAG